ncbi:MAG: pitrilysin family protein [Gemmatimonadota bacterium]|nr:MAG: pitrilysin family protein [Gemmatimonadota bacterium]
MMAGSFARSDVPAPGPIRGFDFPPVSGTRMANGLDLRIVRAARFPIVTAMLILDAGEWGVDPIQAGLAVLAGDALEGGTARHSAAGLAEALEGIGAGLGVTTGWDATTVTVSCLAERLGEALVLMAEVVLEPIFPAEEFDRVRHQRLAAIQQRAMNPSTVAGDHAARFIHADGVPFGRPVAGTEETVGPLSGDDARSWLAKRYCPGGAGLVVVGDVDAGEIEALAAGCFGAWSGAVEPSDPVAVVQRHDGRRIEIVHRPGAVQSEIRMGHVGVSKATPDYFSLLVYNTILGGSFTSRLNLNLRERHGFTYGARSQFRFRRNAGPFVISTAVETAVTADAVREAMSEVETLGNDGPSPDEVDAARDYIVGIFPLRLETTSQLASRVGELIIFGLPDDYHATYRDRLRAVTQEDTAEAGRKHVRPEQMSVVIVGDADEIRAPLEELDLGPVEVHEAG